VALRPFVDKACVPLLVARTSSPARLCDSSLGIVFGGASDSLREGVFLLTGSSGTPGAFFCSLLDPRPNLALRACQRLAAKMSDHIGHGVHARGSLDHITGLH
jgi:hypothetical protein